MLLGTNRVASRIPVVAFVALGMFCFGIIANPKFPYWARLTTVSVLPAAMLVYLGALRRRDCWWPRLKEHLEDHTNALEALSDKHINGWIALASGLALYFELMIIRWQASSFQIFAYYKNVSLLSCFLGLGIGYAMGRRRPVATPLILPALAVQFVGMYVVRFIPNIQEALQNPIAEQLTMGLGNVGTLSAASLVYGFMVLVFTFNAMTFIPLGHLCSWLMQRRPKLAAYSWNLIGSLLGIVAFSLLSFGWTTPSIWLLCGAFGIMMFLNRSRSSSVVVPSALAAMVAIGVVASPFQIEGLEVYSPYQILSLRIYRDTPPVLLVNHLYYQRVVDLRSGSWVVNRPLDEGEANYYELPYMIKRRPDRVLVVGSGMGNDVAAGLRYGAGHIDAVEIDPAILKYGIRLHPEMPYQSDRVETIVNDARAFIRQTDRRYDLIVYGLLDSHTLLSGLASVRLDSFVYTVEGFRDARARLKDKGVITVSFAILSPQQGRKLFLMLKEAFDGWEPRVYRAPGSGHYTYVVGSGLVGTKASADIPHEDVTDVFADATLSADVSTDDWPFFYMPVRTYPMTYVVMMFILLGVSLLVARDILPGLGRGVSPVFFWLGAGFMLIEAKGITELGLTFGNTWLVTSAMISGVLVMAFLANLLIIRFGPPRPAVSYALLGGALIVGMGLSGINVADLPSNIGRTLMVTVLAVPLFFSGLAFSSELKRHGEVPAALSSNLLGSMLGGVLEYNSMYFGFRSLYLLAFVLYGLAFLCSIRARS